MAKATFETFLSSLLSSRHSSKGVSCHYKVILKDNTNKGPLLHGRKHQAWSSLPEFCRLLIPYYNYKVLQLIFHLLPKTSTIWQDYPVDALIRAQPEPPDVQQPAMATTMTSRRKLTQHFQRQRSAPDVRPSQSQPFESQPEEPTATPEEQQQEQNRQASIRAAHDFVYDTINSEDDWSSHMSLIRITCPHTLSELHALGNLPQDEGVAACRKLIRVPVIHEEIGLFIWTQLATLARGPNFADDQLLKTNSNSTAKQNVETTFTTHLDDRFWFDKPASAPARGTIDSPPLSPRQQVQQRSYARSTSSSEPRTLPRSTTHALHLRRHESIDEREEGLEDIRGEALAATKKGGAASRPTKGLPGAPGARPDVDRQRNFFFSPSKNSSHVPLLKWSRERGPPSSAARESNGPRIRSGSLAGRLGSAVGGLGHRVVGVLGESMSHGYQSHNRSQSAKSL